MMGSNNIRYNHNAQSDDGTRCNDIKKDDNTRWFDEWYKEGNIRWMVLVTILKITLLSLFICISFYHGDDICGNKRFEWPSSRFILSTIILINNVKDTNISQYWSKQEELIYYVVQYKVTYILVLNAFKSHFMIDKEVCFKLELIMYKKKKQMISI